MIPMSLHHLLRSNAARTWRRLRRARKKSSRQSKSVFLRAVRRTGSDAADGSKRYFDSANLRQTRGTVLCKSKESFHTGNHLIEENGAAIEHLHRSPGGLNKGDATSYVPFTARIKCACRVGIASGDQREPVRNGADGRHGQL